jgi:hypothetical protein
MGWYGHPCRCIGCDRAQDQTSAIAPLRKLK